jgi:hypothetical protein
MAEPMRTLPQAIGDMTILWNDCQAIVFALFFRLLGVDLPKAQSVFFSISSDRGQRSATAALLATSSSDVAARTVKAINAFGELSGARNAFVHAAWDFPEGSAVAVNWLDTWKRQLGNDPLAKCEELISDLEQHHGVLKALEAEIRAIFSPAQGEAGQDTLSLPLRQGDAQRANSALARQQGDDQEQPPPHQSSDPSQPNDQSQ